MKKLSKSRMILGFALVVVLANPGLVARADGQKVEDGIGALKWFGKKVGGAVKKGAKFYVDSFKDQKPSEQKSEESGDAAIAPPPPMGEEAADDQVAPPPPQSGQELNAFSQPNVIVPRGFVPTPSYKATEDFARRSHKNNLDICVNFIAQSCDGHFTRKLVRALSRGARDVVDSATLSNALRSQGIQNCGHFLPQDGDTEMEAFQKGNQLILFSIPSPTEKDPRQAVCKHSVITMPERLADMKVTENRAWMVGASGTVYYAGGNFQIHRSSKRATSSQIGVDSEGKKLTVTGTTSGLFEANSDVGPVVPAQTRGALSFSDDPRVSDAAADLVPAVNTIRR